MVLGLTRRAVSFVGAAVLMLQIYGTSPAHGSPIILAAAGDIARSTIGAPQQATAGLIAGMNPAKVLALGDEQYPNSEYANYLASYDPTWGAFDPIVSPVPGDQDYGTPGAPGYFQYFANVLTPYGAAATDPTRGYYSFDVGDWHVVALNSNCSQPGLSFKSERTWLAADLPADEHLCQIVFYHHPGQKGFATTAASFGVELALSGHHHVYERRDQLHGFNLRQLIVGTGGKSLGTPDGGADVAVDSADNVATKRHTVCYHTVLVVQFSATTNR